MQSYASVFYRKPIVCIGSDHISRSLGILIPLSICPSIIVLLHIQHRRCSSGTNILTYSSRNSKLQYVLRHIPLPSPTTHSASTHSHVSDVHHCVCDSHLHTLTGGWNILYWMCDRALDGMFDLSAAYAIMDTYAELYVQLSHTKSNKVMSLSRSDVQCQSYTNILQKRLHYQQDQSNRTHPTTTHQFHP